ncbi:MAG: IMP cyclohydrolase [Desulfovibrionales bacterium]
MQDLPVKRAILSVTDKTGIVELAGLLQEGGVEIISTGGTRNLLSSSGIQVTPVSEVTGFPEVLGGRVKTLHPHIHAGILADKDNPSHLESLRSLGIAPIDLVCVNLYDFQSAVAGKSAIRDAVEQIDIGGPTLLRASAKNFHSVAAVPAPTFYPRLKQELRSNGFKLTLEFRREMAVHVFSGVAKYDSMITEYLRKNP